MGLDVLHYHYCCIYNVQCTSIGKSISCVSILNPSIFYACIEQNDIQIVQVPYIVQVVWLESDTVWITYPSIFMHRRLILYRIIFLSLIFCSRWYMILVVIAYLLDFQPIESYETHIINNMATLNSFTTYAAIKHRRLSMDAITSTELISITLIAIF